MMMSTSRRDFLKTAVAAGGAAGLGVLGGWRTYGSESLGPKKSLSILILGGTGFIGPYQVRYALARGHTVTLFNRGKTKPHLFPELEKLRGDREAGDLEALKGREWDVVIDNSSGRPRWTREAAELLRDAANLFYYTSSTGVYYPYHSIDIDEDAPVLDADPEESDDGPSYGVRKVLSERAAEAAFPGRAIVVRPHLIAGPDDPTDRFTYWPVRMSRGGEVMAPGQPTDPIQFIDVRDLTEFTMTLIEGSVGGVFNGVGPLSRMSAAEMLYGIRAISSTDVSFTWVDADFLSEHRVRGWSHLTVWINPTGDYMGMDQINNERSVANGLTFRPLAVTARDTLDWWNSLPEERRAEPRNGLAPDREVEVLAIWHARDER